MHGHSTCNFTEILSCVFVIDVDCVKCIQIETREFANKKQSKANNTVYNI